ncbi:hypothetical protein SAMN04488564_101870 [Lentzea waywayandensis]|uniref:Uncharacterized protein n=1 Tax=Lentzea waywayandensis TaxID=84724 RepID=A0A1I6D297_9PSEU|nr:hypothetical protein SAMN04488564_101870 [Lentzea waywayandensis]
MSDVAVHARRCGDGVRDQARRLRRCSGAGGVIRNALAALALPFRAAPVLAGARRWNPRADGGRRCRAGERCLADDAAGRRAHVRRGRCRPGGLSGVASALVGDVAITLLYLCGHLGEVVRHRVAVEVESRLFRRIATLPGLARIDVLRHTRCGVPVRDRTSPSRRSSSRSTPSSVLPPVVIRTPVQWVLRSPPQPATRLPEGVGVRHHAPNGRCSRRPPG